MTSNSIPPSFISWSCDDFKFSDPPVWTLYETDVEKLNDYLCNFATRMNNDDGQSPDAIADVTPPPLSHRKMSYDDGAFVDVTRCLSPQTFTDPMLTPPVSVSLDQSDDRSVISWNANFLERLHPVRGNSPPPLICVPSEITRECPVDELEERMLKQTKCIIDNETRTAVDPFYVETAEVKCGRFMRKMISEEQRQTFVEWMMDKNEQLKNHIEIAYVAVNYFDRYLSTIRITTKKQFYLLAISCLFLAAKMMEENDDPSIKQHVQVCNMDLTDRDIKRMEAKVAVALNWDLNVITPLEIAFHLLLIPSSPFFRHTEDHQSTLASLSQWFFLAAKSCVWLAYKPSVMTIACLLCILDDAIQATLAPSSTVPIVDVCPSMKHELLWATRVVNVDQDRVVNCIRDVVSLYRDAFSGM